MSAAVTLSQEARELESLMADQPHVPLKPGQLREYQDEMARLTMLVDGRDMEGNVVPWIGGDRAAAAKRRRQINDILNKQAPKELSGEKANRAFGLVNKVLDQDIKPALLPKVVMDRAPAGAVGQYMRSENHPLTKRAILLAKRTLRALDPTNEDPDFCNMERFRQPGTIQNGVAMFDATAIVPGKFGMSPLAKANWPLGEPTADTALGQVVRREAESETNGHAPKPKKTKKAKRTLSLTPEQRAAIGDRLRAAREAKKQASETTAG